MADEVARSTRNVGCYSRRAGEELASFARPMAASVPEAQLRAVLFVRIETRALQRNGHKKIAAPTEE
jgi:hypothetical protein